MPPKKTKTSPALHSSNNDAQEMVIFLDIGVVSYSPTSKIEKFGRLVFKLSPSTHPRTVENFIAFCTGTQLPADKKNKDPRIYSYLGAIFSRVTEDGIQCGDVYNILDFNNFDCNFTQQTVSNQQLIGAPTAATRRVSSIPSPNGIKSDIILKNRHQCIFGQTFEDENIGTDPFIYGTLAMCNSGPNTNGCEFFISTVKNHSSDHDKTTEMVRHLNENYVAFGTLKEGKAVLDDIYDAMRSLSNGDEGYISSLEDNASKQFVICGCGLMTP